MGIAVIIGVTAWDVKDSCETMKDLHKLNVAFNPETAIAPEAMDVCGLEVPTKAEVLKAIQSSPGTAWETAKKYVPDLPELNMPSWLFWN